MNDQNGLGFGLEINFQGVHRKQGAVPLMTNPTSMDEPCEIWDLFDRQNRIFCRDLSSRRENGHADTARFGLRWLMIAIETGRITSAQSIGFCFATLGISKAKFMDYRCGNWGGGGAIGAVACGGSDRGCIRYPHGFF
jgi:hypothetical protein